MELFGGTVCFFVQKRNVHHFVSMGKKISKKIFNKIQIHKIHSKIEEMKRLGLHPALLLYTAGISNVWVLCGDKSACPPGRAQRDRYHG